jgi:ribonuclease I
MVEVVEKIREGFETMKAELDEMKANIDAEKELEREAFEKALEEKFADRAERIENIRSQIVYTEEIEVPDPVEETPTEEIAEATVVQTIY